MEYKIEQYSIHDPGLRIGPHGKPLQEDYISMPRADTPADTARVYIVADGMGDNGLGAVASSTVCDAIRHSLDDKGGNIGVAEIQAAISSGYDALDAADEGPNHSMGTTIAILSIGTSGYIAAHIGDTRIYHIRPGRTTETTKILYRSEDHTMAQHLLKKGEMTAQEAAVSPKRHVLTRAMQPNMQRRCRTDIHRGGDIAPGDYFMLCTDGLLEHIREEHLLTIFSAEGGSAKNKVTLLDKVSSNSADNRSAIIIHVTEVIDRIRSATRPANPTETSRHTDTTNHTDIMDTSSRTKGKNSPTKTRGTAADSTALPLVFKFVLIIMGTLLLIICAYNLFIRQDETLQTAGTAIDPDLLNEETEVYGYEITEQDLRNEAQPLAPEIEATDDEEEYEPEAEAAEDTETTEETHHTTPSDEPILQE